MNRVAITSASDCVASRADPFALEIARLSLTLADVPNPNGWALTEADMFSGRLP